MKSSKKLISAALIGLGGFLEIYFYQFRYLADGLHLVISVTIGAALTIFLMGLTIKREKTPVAIIAGCLIAYSIFTTSTGQASKMTDVKQDHTTDYVQQLNAQDRLDEINQELTELRADNAEYKSQIRATVSSLEDRYEWKNTTAGVEQIIEENNAKIEQLKAERSELRASQTVRHDVEKIEGDVYDFYASMFHISRSWFQFIMQTILSAFIALMAPFGIILLQDEPEKKPVKKYDWTKEAEEWVDRCWVAVRAGRPEPQILKMESFLKSTTDISQRKYQKIKQSALKTGCIARGGLIKQTDQERAKKIIINDLNGGSRNAERKDRVIRWSHGTLGRIKGRVEKSKGSFRAGKRSSDAGNQGHGVEHNGTEKRPVGAGVGGFFGDWKEKTARRNRDKGNQKD